MTFPTALFVATFDVAPDREADFEKWYSEVHVPDALGIPGFKAIRRFVCDGDFDNASGAAKYLNIYEVESADAFRQGWDTDYRRASSADFNRWGPSLSNGNVGFYVASGRRSDA
jgi:hypothetical protein